MAAGQALRHIAQIGERLDIVQLRGGEQGGDDRSSCANRWFLRPSAMGWTARSRVLFVEFDAAVIEETT